jgi:tetratricopeptide (TPR) repeat protein
VDDYGFNNPYSDKLVEEIFRWQDVKQTANDDPKNLWENCYSAIASANEALYAIENSANPTALNAQKGEALVARAYNHFILVNIFSQHYTKEYSDADLGITYMLEPEKTLNPKYERNSVNEVYTYIKHDLEEGLPLINDASYDQPKFHFNKAAAYAFAARVALYTQDWQKAVEYANIAIGENPSGKLRDNEWIAERGVGEVTDAAKFYNSSLLKANLMISTAYSFLGTYFGPYYSGGRFAHGSLLGTTETFMARGPFGQYAFNGYKVMVYRYTASNLDKYLVPRVTRDIEYLDPVAGTGYIHTVYAPFTTEETMLVRAEAYIHLKQYDKAIADMQRWVNNSVKTAQVDLDVEGINAWANGIAYYTPQIPTPKKKLNPEFAIESGTQENMLHALLFIRRLETMHTGLRWFDVKRYGIEINRRIVSGSVVNTVEESTKLTYRDNRQAIQLPQDVISAGLTPNPR